MALRLAVPFRGGLDYRGRFGRTPVIDVARRGIVALPALLLLRSRNQWKEDAYCCNQEPAGPGGAERG